MKKAPELTAERLREVLHYDPETGIFTWIKPTGHRTKPGQRAGAVCKLGYELIGVDGVRYYGHRLAWLYTHGDWPVDQIDHRNFDRTDNRIINLRQACNALNNQGRPLRVNNSSGYTGVCWNALCGKWQVEIQAFKRRIRVGLFSDLGAAVAARKAAEAKYHPFAVREVSHA